MPNLPAEDGLRYLARDLADVAVLQGVEAQSLVKVDPRFKSKVRRVEPSYLVLPLYLAVGQGVSEREPMRIQTIWATIREERACSAYRKLLCAAVMR